MSKKKLFLNHVLIFHRLTISAESPILLSGAQFGALLEFGENCIYEDDFNNDVSNMLSN